jgi:transglutaminase-like putative cysteine protease
VLLRVRHLTEYIFSRPVFLEPHTIRLTPRQDRRQRLRSFDLRLDPAPAGRWEGVDAEGNPFVQAWFDGLAERLVVRSNIEAETLLENPFGFLLDTAACALPPELGPGERAALAPCLDCALLAGGQAEALALDLVGGGSGEGRCGAMDFLLELNGWIFANVHKAVRLEPGILDPEAVCAKGEGACRDTAMLFVQCCRRVGIPARFVSGYHLPEADSHDDSDAHDLHAWAEAWLPGGGWMGLDPTHGLAVADRHLVLAASHDPALAAPLRGSFRGTGASGTLRHEVSVERG